MSGWVLELLLGAAAVFIGGVLKVVADELLATARAEPPVQTADGGVRLAHTGEFGCFGCGALAFGVLLLAAAMIWSSWGGVVCAACLSFGFALPLLDSRCWTELRDEGITDYKPWRGRRTMRWEDVRSISFGYAFDWLAIRDAQGRVFRLSKHLRGIACLRTWAEARLAREVFGKAFDAVR